MPELPEVETVRRGLAPALEGRRLVRVETRRADLRIPFPPDLAGRLTGRTVLRIGRRAKYLRFDCDDGAVLLLHLGMSGRIRFGAPGAPPPPIGPHDHLIMETEDGGRFVLIDPRRFGMAILTDAKTVESHPSLAHLGPEPLGDAFTASYLRRALAGRKTSIKCALLDQRLVAGLGNIYVCESLHRARLSPRRAAASIGAVRAVRLVDAIRATLEDAIAAGGSSLRDYRGATGELGTFQHRFDVYGRTGESCRRPGCGGAVRRILQAGRSTFHCSNCQR